MELGKTSIVVWCNRLLVPRLMLPYNSPPCFLPSHVSLLISITYFYYLSPTEWRCLQWQLWIIVVIFLHPTSCVYRAFRAIFTIKVARSIPTLQSLHMASTKTKLSREYTLARRQLIEVNEDVIVNQARLKGQNEDIGALQSQERLIDNHVGALEEGHTSGTEQYGQGNPEAGGGIPNIFAEHDLKEIKESPEDVAKVVGLLLKGFMRQMGQMDMRLTAQIHSRKAAFGKAEDGSAFPRSPPAIFPSFIGPQQPEPLHSPYDQHPYQAHFQVQAQAGSPSQFNVPASQGHASPAPHASWVKAKGFRPSSTPPVAVSIPVASTPAATTVASRPQLATI